MINIPSLPLLIQKQVLGKVYLTGVMYTPSTLDNYKNCSYTHSSYTQSEVNDNSVEGNNFLKNKELIKVVSKPHMWHYKCISHEAETSTVWLSIKIKCILNALKLPFK